MIIPADSSLLVSIIWFACACARVCESKVQQQGRKGETSCREWNSDNGTVIATHSRGANLGDIVLLPVSEVDL
jgi:hypothetical protein